MKYFGKIFVEFWDNRQWNLAAIPWYRYLYGRFWKVIGKSGSDKDFRHVPRNKIRFQDLKEIQKTY